MGVVRGMKDAAKERLEAVRKATGKGHHHVTIAAQPQPRSLTPILPTAQTTAPASDTSTRPATTPLPAITPPPDVISPSPPARPKSTARRIADSFRTLSSNVLKHVGSATTHEATVAPSPSKKEQALELIAKIRVKLNKVASTDDKDAANKDAEVEDLLVALQHKINEEEAVTEGFFELITEIRGKLHSLGDGRLDMFLQHAGVAGEFIGGLQKSFCDLADKPRVRTTKLLADGSFYNSFDILLEAVSRGKEAVDAVVATELSVNPFKFREDAIPVLQKISRAIDILPLLIEAYNNSDLDRFLPEKAPSLESVQHSVSKHLTKLAQKILNKYTSHQQQFKFLKGFRLSNDEETLKRFKALPPVVKYGMLVAMQEINGELADFNQLIREINIRANFPQDALINVMKVKLQFDENSPFHQLSINGRTLKEFCDMLSVAYKTRMELCHFVVKEDLYPFPRTNYHELMALYSEVISKRDEDMAYYHNKFLQAAYSKSVAYIEQARIDTKNPTLLQSTYVRIKVLQVGDTQNLEEAVAAIEEEAKVHAKTPEFVEVYKYFLNAREYYQSREANVETLIQNIIREIGYVVAVDPTLVNSKPDTREGRHELLFKNLNGTVEEVQKLIERFTAMAVLPAKHTPTPGEADSSPMGVAASAMKIAAAMARKSEERRENILVYAFNTTEHKLRTYLDAEIFNRYFVEGNQNTDASDEEVWIKDLGQMFLAAKRAVATIDNVIADFSPDKEDHQRLPTDPQTPSEALAETVKAAQKSMTAVNDLVDAASKMYADPFLQECFTELQQIVRLGSIPKIEIHPWYQFVKTEGVAFAKRILTSEYALTATLGVMENHIDTILRPFTKAEKATKTQEITPEQMRTAVIDTLSSMRKISKAMSPLWDASQPGLFIDAGNPSTRDQLQVLFKHMHDIYKITRNLSLAYDALARASQKQLEVMITELLNIFQQGYLFLRKIEKSFYLKAGTLTKSPRPLGFDLFGNKSVADMITEFEEAMIGCGYKVQPEQRCPYDQAAVKQSEELLALVDAKKNQKVKRNFIAKRLEQEKEELEWNNNQLNIEKNKNIPRDYVLQRIDERIDEIKDALKKRWFFMRWYITYVTHTVDLKIKLLTRLKTEMELRKKPLEEALSVLSKHEMLGKHVGLLRENNILDELRISMSEPNAVARRIQKEINSLRKQKANLSFLVRMLFRNWKNTLTERIDALEALKSSVIEAKPLDADKASVLKPYDSDILQSCRTWLKIKKKQFAATVVDKSAAGLNHVAHKAADAVKCANLQFQVKISHMQRAWRSKKDQVKQAPETEDKIKTEANEIQLRTMRATLSGG